MNRDLSQMTGPTHRLLKYHVVPCLEQLSQETEIWRDHLRCCVVRTFMQDEPNPALWLATWLETTRCVPQEKNARKPYDKSFIDHSCSVKMAELILASFFLHEFMDLNAVSVHKHAKQASLACVERCFHQTLQVYLKLAHNFHFTLLAPGIYIFVPKRRISLLGPIFIFWRIELIFLHTLFLQNEAQITKNNYGTMLFMSKQVSLPKISLILKKWKSAQKAIFPFLHETLQLLHISTCICPEINEY